MLPVLKVFPPGVVESTDGFAEIPEVVGRAQVELLAVVVGDDPGEHGVLVEIVVGPPRYRVQEHQILKVGYLTPLPLLSHV